MSGGPTWRQGGTVSPVRPGGRGFHFLAPTAVNRVGLHAQKKFPRLNLALGGGFYSALKRPAAPDLGCPRPATGWTCPGLARNGASDGGR